MAEKRIIDLEDMKSDILTIHTREYNTIDVIPVDCIADLPVIEDEYNWVSVEDRLPEEKGQYLVTYHPCYWDDVREDLRVGFDSYRGGKNKTNKVWAKTNINELPIGNLYLNLRRRSDYDTRFSW